jgi:MSHA biogenesis protein MshG
MKHYLYKAMNAQRQTVEGDTYVEERKDLDKFFLERHLMPLKVEEERINHFSAIKRAFDVWWNKKLFETELITFTRQFAAAYGAGIPVAATFELLAGQAGHTQFKTVLLQIARSIQAGKGLVESIAAHPHFFDNTYRAMLLSGEVTGNLDTVLNYVANLLEKRKAHRERIASTLLYPKIVVFFIGVCMVVVLTFVIPQFKKIFDKFEAELPMPTRILMGASDIFVQYWWALFLVIPLYIFLQEYLKRREDFMLFFHEQLLAIPLMGTIFLKAELTHFCTTFAILLRAGIKVTDSAATSISALSNSYLKNELKAIIPTVEQGGTLTKAIGAIRVVPPLMTSMIMVGEQSGSLDILLERVAKLYDEESEALLKKLPTFLEPIILSFLFVMVLFLALAVYLPMWKMASIIKK